MDERTEMNAPQQHGFRCGSIQPPMRVGIDARSLEMQPAGIGRYIHEISKILDELLPQAEFFLYSRTPLTIELISPRWTHRCEPIEAFRKIKSIVWLKTCASRLAVADRLDFYWGAATFMPRLPRHVVTISTAHDINHVLVPETMPFLTLQAYRLFFHKDLKRAKFVMSNSDGTAQRIKALHGIDSDLIIKPGVSGQFIVPSDATVAQSMRDLRIDSPYILGLSTLEPRKNLLGLVKAFMALKVAGQLPQGFKLLLVGGAGWGGSALEDLLRQTGDVVRLGYVDDKYLPSLYRAAKAFVFPSIYEGFGIPVLEAMACGAKVVASDIPELREASEDKAVYIAPDIEGIKAGIIKVLNDEDAPPTVDRYRNSWKFHAENFASLIDAEYRKMTMPS